MTRFDLSRADVEAIDDAQRGADGAVRCYGCQRATGAARALAYDHDHRLGDTRPAVRGRLCAPCNRLIGHLRDDPQALLRLGLYLIDPPAQRALRKVDEQESAG